MKNKLKYCIAILLVVSLVVVGAYAFLTATDVKTNNFTVGNVKIKVVEPIWDAENPDGSIDKIVPSKIFNKDPAIKNTGLNDAYVYMRVWMPIADGLKVFTDEIQKDGTYTKTVNDAELFETIKTTTGDSGEWVLIDKELDNTQGYNYYLYAYNVPIAPGETTGTLFDKLKTVNIANGIENVIPEYKNVVIEGFAIQSDYKDHQFTYESAWDAFVKQKGYEWPDNPATNQISFFNYSGEVLLSSGAYKQPSDTYIINQTPSENNEAFAGWVGDNNRLYQNNTEVLIEDLYLEDENGTVLNINLKFKEYIKNEAVNSEEGTDQIMLVPNYNASCWSKENPCTTIIDRQGQSVSSYEEGVTEWFIYGLEEIFLEEMISDYITVQGDGYYTVEKAKQNTLYYGTGSVVTVWDRNGTEDISDDNITEKLYFVIFGDVDGNSYVNAGDVSIAKQETQISDFSDKNSPNYGPAALKAGDCNSNGYIDAMDVAIINQHTLGMIRIDQQTGLSLDPLY